MDSGFIVLNCCCFRVSGVSLFRQHPSPLIKKKKAARKQSNWKYDIPPQTGVPQKESGCPWQGALHPYEQTMGISLPQDLSICLNALCWQRQTQINNSLKGDPSEGGWLNNLKELMI